ncbi:SDR family oxidoreductase [Allosediminivita pacifica]|uniref:2-keto-3-deoxy-L-fuconate dehydrogenase n=1 Tax=Allosediminivita pacifica TaxID=1267769 RepID=A0A2T6AQ40_9RHOB|nr:SDR family oxidoreductase [Allosediminivita pacifica]PTX45922.1 2-keto-3-deoxy-L-fuconate dehydrogenase [Allosediminivita pacifica]GGB19061.1 NAD(P)-dependent oxidoreductase [Allosediminivita pacifica]
MTDLTGQKVLITAAAQGIGRATTEAFLRAGADVIATDINEEALATLTGCTAARLDVRDPSAIADLMAATGPVDVLFNCAGFVHAGSVLEASDEDLAFAWDLNVMSMIRMIRAVLPGMLERGGGCILNMSSVASAIKGVPNRFAYSTTKAAVLGMTKSVSADYVGQGIRCNAICPGTVQSPSLDQRLAATGDYDKARAEFIARQPMGRIAEAEEIADLAVYLAGATYTTGQALCIDGGWTI